MLRHLFACFLLMTAGAGIASSQLAITEVMAAGSINQGGITVWPGPDFFELTNFGTNVVNLDGYSFSDNATTNRITAGVLNNVMLQSGESILVAKRRNNSSATNEMQFCQWWWGTTNLTECPARVLFHDGAGFNRDNGDEVWLYDPAGEVVDMVAFGESIDGLTFTYDPGTGIFGRVSECGVDGAFPAIEAEDCGSPGITTGPVLLSIVQQPEDAVADGCVDVTFTVVGGGLPRPQYQWMYEGLDIPGATTSSLTITNPQPETAGFYSVRLSTYLSSMVSREALLAVNTNPLSPSIISPPEDVICFEDQRAPFSVRARAFPCPNYQWQADGIDIMGATNRNLETPPVTLAMSGTQYSVQVSNALGAIQVSAELTVTTRPCLKITEIMALPNDTLTTDHDDWFELTNCDTNAVNLKGYRFRDIAAFSAASVITNALVIEPGESVIFVRNMTPEAFRDWWGADHLPPNCKVVTFTGFNLNTVGEPLYLWNAHANDDLDAVTTSSSVFSFEGISLERDPYFDYCDPAVGCTTGLGVDSAPGVRGAFRAQISGDIGSPCYTSNPELQFVSISHDAMGVKLKWRSVQRKSYRLLYTDNLSEPWGPLSTHVATNSIVTVLDASAGGSPQRFYLLEEQ